MRAPPPSAQDNSQLSHILSKLDLALDVGSQASGATVQEAPCLVVVHVAVEIYPWAV